MFSHINPLALPVTLPHDGLALMNWGVQKMQTSLKYMLATALLLLGSSAWSDCACFCVAGELETMCTTVDGAQDSPNLCPATESASCPVEFGEVGSSSYEAPKSDAVNCRDVRVYDAIRGDYIDAKACNVI